MGILTEGQENKVIEMYMQGTPGTQIAKAIGVSYSPVYAVLRRRGIDLKAVRNAVDMKDAHRKLTRANETEIAERYERGEVLSSIAQQFGVSLQTVANALERHGITRRPQGGQERRFAEDEVAEILERWDRKEGVVAIARALRSSVGLINDVLDGHGRQRIPGAKKGSEHHRWRGGEFRASGGYVKVLVSADSPFASMRNSLGYVLKHRLVLAESLGRPLLRTETVHHIDGDRSNNELANLQLMQKWHGSGVTYQCLDCGSYNVREAALQGAAG